MAADLQDSVAVIGANFEDVTLHGDVVYFEFCLHEMDYPQRALVHARARAPDIVVFDHLPGSDWVFYSAEEEKVRRSQAMERFRDDAELFAKVKVQGATAIHRAQHFAGAPNIVIPMSYELALL